MEVVDTLTYYDTAKTTTVRSFIVQDPAWKSLVLREHHNAVIEQVGLFLCKQILFGYYVHSLKTTFKLSAKSSLNEAYAAGS
jgi:hypothetical protein